MSDQSCTRATSRPKCPQPHARAPARFSIVPDVTIALDTKRKSATRPSENGGTQLIESFHTRIGCGTPSCVIIVDSGSAAVSSKSWRTRVCFDACISWSLRPRLVLCCRWRGRPYGVWVARLQCAPVRFPRNGCTGSRLPHFPASAWTRCSRPLVQSHGRPAPCGDGVGERVRFRPKWAVSSHVCKRRPIPRRHGPDKRPCISASRL